MGMFDYCRVLHTLPPLDFDPCPNLDDFQTKSMPHPFMDTYVIEADGTLWYSGFDWDKEKNGKPHPIPYSGQLEFYSSTSLDHGIRFQALFDDGHLLWIKAIRWIPGETIADDREEEVSKINGIGR